MANLGPRAGSIWRTGQGRLGEIVLIHDLKWQGLSVAAIARKVGHDRKTVRKYLDQRLEPPVYRPREPRSRLIKPYEGYLRERIVTFPDLSGKRLLREIRELGYSGGYTAVTDFLRIARPPHRTAFERRFETPAGKQAQSLPRTQSGVDFAEFKVAFTDEPGVTRKVWLFSLVLGHSRWIWGRFCASQDLQTVLRRHIAAFDAISVPAGRRARTFANSAGKFPRSSRGQAFKRLDDEFVLGMVARAAEIFR